MNLYCIECFHADGNIRPADFIVNGQSACQRHVHMVIGEPNAKGKVYVWGDANTEPKAVDA